MGVLSIYMHVPWAYLVPVKARRGHCIPRLDLLRFRASLLVWEASTGTQKEQPVRLTATLFLFNQFTTLRK